MSEGGRRLLRDNLGVAAGTGALDVDLDAAQTVLDCRVGGALGGLLSGIGRALAAALEPDCAR